MSKGMDTTVYVSGASGIVGYGILKSLRAYDPTIRLVGSTVHDESVAPAFCDIFEKAPYTTDPSYFDWLAAIVKKHAPNLLVPSIEGDVYAWGEHRDFFAQQDAVVLLNCPKLIELCKDKWLFFEELRRNNSPYAIESCLAFDPQKHAFPLLLKPRCGFASRGIIIVNNEEQLREHSASLGSQLMIQPVVGCVEEEYTTSAFFTSESALCAHMTLRRKLSKQGFTEVAYTAEMPEIADALTHLATIFKPVGPTNFQFRKEGTQLKLLEINPRISSATSIRTAFGYNESRMAVEYFIYGKVPVQPSIRKGHSVRYTEDFIFYDSPDI